MEEIVEDISKPVCQSTSLSMLFARKYLRPKISTKTIVKFQYMHNLTKIDNYPVIVHDLTVIDNHPVIVHDLTVIDNFPVIVRNVLRC